MEDSNPMLVSRDEGSCSNNFSLNNSKLPESPRLPMEFLSRSWSLPALQLSKALSQSLPSLLSKTVASCTTSSNPNPNTIPILEEEHGSHNHHSVIFNPREPSDDNQRMKLISGNSFSFASSATSQLVLDRIMSQSEVSPMTSGRPSCSEPPNGVMVGQSFSSSSITPEMFDSPTSDPLSPPMDFDKFACSSTPQPLLAPIRVGGPRTGGTAPVVGTGGSSKTVGRWLKERREKKKEESRVHNAQVHAAVSVAAVAAAVAATASATAAAAQMGKDEQAEQTQTDMAIATAATLVAARCVEAAEAMGAERDHLASVISSAVNVQSHGDIMTLTAAAATALRGAATLKARTVKEVCNIAAVLPVERGLGTGPGTKGENGYCQNGSYNGDTGSQGENFLGLCNEQLLARGAELLKRTRTGELHWKIVSVYIDKTGQVILKMKSRHVAGTLTKKKKKILMEVCKDMPTWPERRIIEAEGEERRYFGLKTATHRVIQFECKNQQEYDVWTQGVSRLLAIANEQKKNGTFARSDVYWN